MQPDNHTPGEQRGVDVYLDGKIYVGATMPIPTYQGEYTGKIKKDIPLLDIEYYLRRIGEFLDHLKTLQSYPLIGPHSFKDGQQVVEGKDYKIQRQVFPVLQKEWVNFSGTEAVFNLVREDTRRIVAIPLPSKGQEGEAERKAKELVEKFWHEISGVPAHCGVDVHSKDSYVILAKQCALICVDEILKAINGDGISWDINSYFLNGKHVSCKDYKQFWQQVRHNILNR